MLTHVDLFSGIGGFALAAQWAGFKTVCFCEIDKFCQEVLKTRFGAIADTASVGWRDGITTNKGKIARKINSFSNAAPLLIPDIRNLDGTRFRGATLLTGGVPCQPASIAGERRGKKDDRWLWPEALRVLGEIKPAWAIFENPPGILSLEQGVVFEELLTRMEGEGYEAWSIVVPACAVNAPHRRDRVWIIAHAGRAGTGSERREITDEARHPGQGRREGIRQGNGTASSSGIASADSDASNTINDLRQSSRPQQDKRRMANENKQVLKNAPNAEKRGRRQECQDTGGTGERTIAPEKRRGLMHGSWDTPWPEIASRLCSLDDGLSAGLAGRPLRNKNRVQRLRAIGNAIVPQVAYAICKAIAEIKAG